MPTGLGADYEHLVLGRSAKRKRRASAFRASKIGYRLASWLLSLIITVVAFFVAIAIAEPFVSDGWSVLAGFGTLVVLIFAWRRSWRRYRAPLIVLLPRSDYQSFTEWQSSREPSPEHRRLKLDLRILKRVGPEE